MVDVSKLLFADGQQTVTLTQAQLEALMGAQAPPEPSTAATVPPAVEAPVAVTPPAVDPARELAFLKAGIDVTTPAGKYLFDTYPGELTVEAVKAVAEPLGLVPSSASPVTSGELSQTEVRTGLQHNATVAPGQEPEVHPIIAAAKDAVAVIDRGGSYLDAVAAHINRVSRAGMEGDTRVLSRGNAGPGEPVQPVVDRKGFDSIREVQGFAPRVIG